MTMRWRNGATAEGMGLESAREGPRFKSSAAGLKRKLSAAGFSLVVLFPLLVLGRTLGGPACRRPSRERRVCTYRQTVANTHADRDVEGEAG